LREALKLKLLRICAPLDRGAAALTSDRAAVEEAVSGLEATCELAPSDCSALLSGSWRLVYSSGFAGQAGTAPPGAGTPLRLGTVLQRIQPAKATLDNIVELSLPLPPVTFSLCLRHRLELTGCTARITFTELQLRPPRGLRGARPLSLPSPLQLLPGLQEAAEQAAARLFPTAGPRAGEFETTYVDDELRVARGALGELRLFLKA